MFSERTNSLNSVAKKIREFYRILKKEFNQTLESEGVTNGEFLMLRSVESGSGRVSDMAGELGVSASYITSLSDKMIAKGYIERVRSETDRRSVSIKLTKEGKRKYSRMEKQIRKYLTNKFDALTDSELKQFDVLLNKVFSD